VLAEGILYFKKRVTSRIIETIKNFYRKVMDLPDSPKKTAKGVALGLALDFLPIPVISIPISYLVARLTRCNPIASVATVIFFKPAVPFFFTLNVLVGSVLLGTESIPEVTGTAGMSLLSSYLDQMLQYGYPFLLGSVINAVIIGLSVYYLSTFLLEKRRRRGGA